MAPLIRRNIRLFKGLLRRSRTGSVMEQIAPVTAVRGNAVQPSFLVHKEPFPVRGPVGGLNEEGKFADDLVGAALEVVDFQAAGYVLCHSRMKGCDKQE